MAGCYVACVLLDVLPMYILDILLRQGGRRRDARMFVLWQVRSILLPPLDDRTNDKGPLAAILSTCQALEREYLAVSGAACGLSEGQ